MKKHLFLFAAAAVALASCSSDDTIAENSSSFGNQQQKEIAFMPISQPNTRGQYSVIGDGFPNDNSMEVAAYQTSPTETSYFAKCTFSKGTSTWTGGKYWPLSEAKLNFFAVSGYGIAANKINIENNLTSATVDYTSPTYGATTQSDIMYAFNRGAVTKSTNTLYFNGGSPVQMVFKHALALVDFEVMGYSTAERTNIKVNSITVKGGTYNGSLTLTNTNADKETGTVTPTVSWVAGDAVDEVAVPGITANTAITDAYTRIGNGLMIIPGTGFTSFVVNYTFDSKTYDYEYTLPSALVSVAANKYTYRITFKLHEIEIAPEITPWTNTNNDITIVE